MKKIMSLASVLVVLLVILPGCGSSQPTTPKTSPPAASQPSTQPTTGDQSIAIQGFAYTPLELTVLKGTTVTWTNEDTVVHNVVGGVLQSKDLAKGQSFSYTFTETGTIDYICTYHPSMKGKIIVK